MEIDICDVNNETVMSQTNAHNQLYFIFKLKLHNIKKPVIMLTKPVLRRPQLRILGSRVLTCLTLPKITFNITL